MTQKYVPCVNNYKRLKADEEVLFQPDDERKLYQMKCTSLLAMYSSKGRRNRTCARTNTDLSENHWSVRSFCISGKVFWMFDTVLSSRHVKNKELHLQVIIKEQNHVVGLGPGVYSQTENNVQTKLITKIPHECAEKYCVFVFHVMLT